MQAANYILKPPPLRSGDRVGIVAPSSPVEADRLADGCAALRHLGYEPFYKESILSSDLYFAGSSERRARELEAMFAREDVRAVICARGGYGCNYLLPHIDLEVIRRHPKIFVGYSDVTTLLTWFHDRTGLVTFHGPMVARDFAVAHGVDLPSWHAKTGGEIELQRSTLLTPLVPGRADGKLYGGCLSMLAASLGTPYAVNTEGTILYIEDVNTKPYQLDRMLMQLRLAGKLAGVRGIIFGEMQNCAPPEGSSYTLLDVLRRCVQGLGIPVAFGANSGHVKRGNLTLAFGVQASLIVEPDYAAAATLEQIGKIEAPKIEVHTLRSGACRAARKASAWKPSSRASTGASISFSRGGIDVVGIEANLIVYLALLGIAQDVIGLGDGLEPFLGRLVAGIDIRMVLAGELAEGFADVLGRGRLLHPESFVIILLGRCSHVFEALILINVILAAWVH